LAVFASVEMVLIVTDGALAFERRVIAGVIFLAGVLLIAWVGWRTATAGVGVQPDGVIVRNMLGSRQVRWDDIVTFSALRYGAYRIGYVELRNGERIRTRGIQGRVQARFPDNTWPTQPIDDLNEILADCRDARANGRLWKPDLEGRAEALRAMTVPRARYLRSRQHVWWIAGATVLLMAFWLDAAAQGLVEVNRTPGHRLSGGVVSLAIGLLTACVGWRVATAGVGVGDAGVIVRNVSWSERLRWDQIARFSIVTRGRYSIGCVELRSGRRMCTWGIKGTIRHMFTRKTRLTEPIDSLNRILAQHQLVPAEARSIHNGVRR
jgi:hypothetical protein